MSATDSRMRGGLVNVIADVLKLCRAAEDKERLHACFDGAANVGLHGVANHHALIERTPSGFGEFAARLVEHIAVGFAEMKRAPARAGFVKAASAPAPGRVLSLETGHQLSGLVASSRAPRSMHSCALASFSVVAPPSPTTT